MVSHRNDQSNLRVSQYAAGQVSDRSTNMNGVVPVFAIGNQVTRPGKTALSIVDFRYGTRITPFRLPHFSTNNMPRQHQSHLICRLLVLLALIVGSNATQPLASVAQDKTAKAEKNSPSSDEVGNALLTADQLAAAQRWENDIEKLEKRDQLEDATEDAVLLIGSSSIRLWANAAEGLAPYPVINRGYGGAKYSDLAHYAPRLIEPHSFQAAVVFVANDIVGGTSDHAVADVEKWVRSVIGVAQGHQPNAPILLVEVTPTPSRLKVWAETRRLNAMLREVALTLPGVYFVATAEFYLDADDQPRRDLFRGDMLHQNDAGYQRWGSLIKRRLDEVLEPQLASQS